ALENAQASRGGALLFRALAKARARATGHARIFSGMVREEQRAGSSARRFDRRTTRNDRQRRESRDRRRARASLRRGGKRDKGGRSVAQYSSPRSEQQEGARSAAASLSAHRSVGSAHRSLACGARSHRAGRQEDARRNASSDRGGLSRSPEERHRARHGSLAGLSARAHRSGSGAAARARL